MLEDKKGLSLFQMIVVVYCMGFGMYSLWRGAYWVFFADKASTESPLYMSMHQIISLFWWGMPFLIAGVLLMIAGLMVPYYKTNNYFLYLFTIGHIISMVFYYIFTLAGFHNAINILTPGQNLTWAVISGVMAFIGGVSLWNQKTAKK